MMTCTVKLVWHLSIIYMVTSVYAVRCLSVARSRGHGVPACITVLQIAGHHIWYARVTVGSQVVSWVIRIFLVWKWVGDGWIFPSSHHPAHFCT